METIKEVLLNPQKVRVNKKFVIQVKIKKDYFIITENEIKITTEEGLEIVMEDK